MDLTSSQAFWPLRDGLLAAYPPLESAVSCDVVVVGAGITGALVADRLVSEGHDVIVLDRRDVGRGSTGASTALLQYEIDVHLCDLIPRIGRDEAERAYRLCRDAVLKLERLAGELEPGCGFARKESLYVATTRKEARQLRDECSAREAAGLEVEHLEGNQLGSRYPLSHRAALVSRPAASCDPYQLAHALLARAQRRGARIFDRTCARLPESTRNGVRIETDRGYTVQAGLVVMATGYEATDQRVGSVVKLKNTYALVTQPLANLGPWNPEWILWEAARPYLYFRATDDGRLLAGGEDTRFRSLRHREAKVARRGRRILNQLKSLLPNLPLEAEFMWAGTFGETEDGLAYIGEAAGVPKTYFVLGYGGNGITFSVIGADIIADLVAGRANADAQLFRFGR